MISAQGYFTEKLWQSITPVFNNIINCRFVVELANASLPQSCFAHYLSQDVLYLKQDNEAFKLISQRTSDKEEKQFFNNLANDSIAVEQTIRNEYLTEFNIREAKKQSPVFKKYGLFILDNAANAPYSVALAGLLPCFWLYGEIGKYIFRHQMPNNKYQKFIDTYSDESYDIITNRFIQLVEQYGQQATTVIKEQMNAAFQQSAQYEYLVFKEAENVFKAE